MTDNMFEKIMLEAEAPADGESIEREYTWTGGIKKTAIWNGEKWELKK